MVKIYLLKEKKCWFSLTLYQQKSVTSGHLLLNRVVANEGQI